jgi:hypothetical protein
MTRLSMILCVLFWSVVPLTAAQAVVHVELVNLDGPRPLGTLTQKAAIHDYLESWGDLEAAFAQNRESLLNVGFVGDAKEKLANAIQEQTAIGVSTLYQARAHDLRIVFYSPEGLSIELTDDVKYNVQVFDHQKRVATRETTARYIVVLTPSEVRWRVRVFQALLD